MPGEGKYAEERRRWIASRRNAGEDPYPNDFRRTDLAASLRDDAGGMDREALEVCSRSVRVAGRVIGKREMGATGFATLRDMSGDIQLMVGAAFTGKASLDSFARVDAGDIVGVEGGLTRTRTGELTVRVVKMALLVKSLRPLPKEFYGLKDIEQRYRKRYLDLILNPGSKAVFQQRARIISSIRRFFDQRDFIEVETPMMQQLPGGAAARPFVTHHNALGVDLYLRVAPELYLKRLVVGGMEQVYEINRNFRNEGVSTKHNPEFTMLEFYRAYANHDDLMAFTEELLRAVCKDVKASARFEYQGLQCDLSQPFERLTMDEALLRHNRDLDEGALRNPQRLAEYAAARGVAGAASLENGVLRLALFEKTVEHELRQPTFVTSFPLAVSPLARPSDARPDTVDRFELYIAGIEIANGFSELNDADDQRRRLQHQAAVKTAGDDEAMYYDGDYIEALEHGLPPTAGEGIGIDRLVMLLTDSASIRDVILFPQMRPR